MATLRPFSSDSLLLSERASLSLVLFQIGAIGGMKTRDADNKIVPIHKHITTAESLRLPPAQTHMFSLVFCSKLREAGEISSIVPVSRRAPVFCQKSRKYLTMRSLTPLVAHICLGPLWYLYITLQVKFSYFSVFSDFIFICFSFVSVPLKPVTPLVELQVSIINQH